MLIEFTVGNYLSFKEKKTLSLEATSIKENPDNVIKAGKYKLLRSAVIYGANSSGKSNFLKALNKMKEIVISSVQNNSTSEIDLVPFLLSSETDNQPSYFEILFLMDGIRYRYGFEADNKIIHSEWLFERKMKIEKALFFRDKDSIEVTSNFEEGKGIEEKTRGNALFLSIADQFNGEISKKIMSWFSRQFSLSGLQHEKANVLTLEFLRSEDLISLIKDFLSPLGLGFQDIYATENKIVTLHNKFDERGNIIAKQEFDLLKQESSGTNKLYDMAGIFIRWFKNWISYNY